MSTTGREGPAIKLDGDAIRVDLPTGWEGGITRNPARTRSLPPVAQGSAADPGAGSTALDDPDDGPDDGSDGDGLDGDPDATAPVRPDPNTGRGVERDPDGSVVMPVAHLANFALPAALDVFGSQAVTTMRAGDGFVALVEYGPAEADTALFERRGVPRRLGPADFSAHTLNRVLPDQVGTQVFATEAGRAFCLYVVLAGRADLRTTLQAVNDVLSTLEITPR